MKIFYIVVLLWLLADNRAVIGGTTIRNLDILNSGNSVVKGIGKEISNIIPTPNELFEVSKEVLFGLPETFIFKTVNRLCSLYMASDTIKPRVTPDSNLLTLRLRKPCMELSFSLKKADEIIQSPDFDVNKKVALFVTGWMSSSEADYVSDMADAFNCRGDYNFLVLNSSNSIDTLYTWSAYNTEEVGRLLAVAIQKLAERIPIENIHLIGHSLGAHIVGYAGRYFKTFTSLNLTRITGLDPANPCFNEGETLSGLQRGDAEYIDIIHTNPGVLGKAAPVGDVDFYAEGLAPIKPGCVKFGCSHGRAYEFFTESVYPGNEFNFLGVRCSSLNNMNNGVCRGPGFPMGFAVPYNLKGNYFFSVNAQKPYGKNHNDKNMESSECGKCVMEGYK